jgi:alpha-beta hydrolase superfamily lysophospholipase
LADATLETFTASDGYRCHYRKRGRGSFSEKDPRPLLPRAHLVCLHGIQSHGGWYDLSCRCLAEAGFDVWFLERRGSGLNQEARGDTPSFRRLLDDLVEFLRQRRRTSPAIPIYLVGISWGGKLAVALERYYRGFADGLILLCPGLFPKVRPRWLEQAGIAVAALTAPKRMFDIPLNDPELFTATPHWQQFLRDDPLALHQATARFFFQSVLLDRYLRRVPRYVKIPVLLLLAGRDRIIDNTATIRFAARFAAADKTIVEYPDAHHTLEFEPDPGRFVDDMVRWLDHRLR